MALKKERGSSKSKGLCKLSIDQDLTIYTIEQLKDELTGYLNDYQHFEMDLSKVEETDSAGIQLLIAVQNSLRVKEKTLCISSVSESVATIMAAYAISDRFTAGGCV
jgi:anti-sigma B factor antagonist